MQDYSDVPEELREEYPNDRFVDELLERTALVIERRQGSDKASLLGLALEVRPRQSLIELSLLTDPEVAERSRVAGWDRHLETTQAGLTELWQPVRDAFVPEQRRWRKLCKEHPKAGGLYIYTLLGAFVFNLRSGPIADALDRVPTTADLQVYAVNYEDPTLPNVFEIEYERVTLREPRPPETPPKPEPEPEPRYVDPNQLRLF